MFVLTLVFMAVTCYGAKDMPGCYVSLFISLLRDFDEGSENVVIPIVEATVVTER